MASAPTAVTKSAFGAAVGMLKGIVVTGLAVGILVSVSGRLGKRDAAPVPAPGGLDAKRQAVAVCDAALRDRAQAPFRVIALRSTLVAEDRGGYVVSGTVELQSIAGEVRRSRYFCRVRADARAGMVLDAARID